MTTLDADRRQPLPDAWHVPTPAGTVVSVRGSVVDIRFDRHLLPIYSALRAGADTQIGIGVLAQRDARHEDILSRMFDACGHVIAREPALSDFQW